MNNLFILLVLVMFAAVSNAQSVDTPSSLQLVTQEIGKHYCLIKGDPPSEAHLVLVIKLIFTNKSSQNIILQKGSNDLKFVRIGKNNNFLNAKKYELNMNVSYDYPGKGETSSSSEVPPYGYSILKPGENYEINQEVRVVGYKRRLIPGRHVLEVVVPTWNGTKEQALELRKRWAKTGLLSFSDVTSSPIWFTVEKIEKFLPCQ